MGPGLFWNFPSKTSCMVSQTLLQTMYVVLLATVALRLFFFFWHSVHLFISFCPSFISHKFHRPKNRDVCSCHLEENTFTDLCCMQATNHCTAWGHFYRLQVNSYRLLSCCFLVDGQSVQEFMQKRKSEITWINNHSSIPVGFFLAVEQRALVLRLADDALVCRSHSHKPTLILDCDEDEDAIKFSHTFQKKHNDQAQLKRLSYWRQCYVIYWLFLRVLVHSGVSF